MLTLENLTFAYPGQAQPYRFDLTVEPGEIVAVTGASGSGKSTLLDLVAGFLVPSSGSLALDGRDLLPLPPERRPVSILFQADNLFDHLTAAANLALALPRMKGPARGERIAAALRQVGLDGYAERRGNALSGGERQRVALARTLLLDRPVLLLDEPLSALDEETAGRLRTMIRELAATRRWHVILVTHTTGDVRDLADRTCVLRDHHLQWPAP